MTKRIKLELISPETGDRFDVWLSTPTPYVLELITEAGVDISGQRSRQDVLDVDGVRAAVPATDKELAALTPKERKEAVKTRKELLENKAIVDAMTPEEETAMRAAASKAARDGIKQTNAMLAAFLTMQEDEDSAGMPIKVWSRKQAADVIPWDDYEHVAEVLRTLMDDATSKQEGEKETGEAEAVDPKSH